MPSNIAAGVKQAYIIHENRRLQPNSNDLLNATENTDGIQGELEQVLGKW